jgi:hypothetical protein
VAAAVVDQWGSGGRQVGLTNFFIFFYILQKCLPSVGFIHGKLFAECL